MQSLNPQKRGSEFPRISQYLEPPLAKDMSSSFKKTSFQNGFGLNTFPVNPDMYLANRNNSNQSMYKSSFKKSKDFQIPTSHGGNHLENLFRQGSQLKEFRNSSQKRISSRKLALLPQFNFDQRSEFPTRIYFSLFLY